MEELNVDNVKVGLKLKSKEDLSRYRDCKVFESGSVFEVVEVIDDYKNANTEFDPMKAFTIRRIDDNEELFLTELMFRCFSIVPKELSYKTLKIGTIVQCNCELRRHIDRTIFPKGIKFEVSYIETYPSELSHAEDGTQVIFTLKELIRAPMYGSEVDIFTGEEINMTENCYYMFSVLE